MENLSKENIKPIKKLIPVYQPYFSKRTIGYAKDALDSGWVSSLGPYKAKAEELLKKTLSVKYVVLTNNGTSATHLLAAGLKFLHPHIKNILVPDAVFVAAWNSFIFNPSYNLIPVPSDPHTWNVDLQLLEKEAQRHTPQDTAILLVHNLGNIININEVKKRCPKFVILEDNCEGFGGKYNGRSAGTQSLAASLSFFGNKNITCGEGGALLTNNRKMYDFVKKTHSQGQSTERYVHDIMGYNYRMTNIQAALLYGQLKDLRFILSEKQKIFDYYRSSLKSDSVALQVVDPCCSHSNWMFGVKLREFTYPLVSAFLSQYGVDTRPFFYPMSCHHHLVKHAAPENEGVAQALNQKVCVLPSYPGLQQKELKKIAQHVLKFIKT